MSYTQPTFSFKGVSVTTIVADILIPEIRRPLRPQVTRHKLEIPGKSGSWDFGDGVKQDFNIEVDFILRGATVEETRNQARALDTFLDGKGDLVFTDDPGETYSARVYAAIGLDKIVFSRVVEGTIIFECDAEYEEQEITGQVFTPTVTTE